MVAEDLTITVSEPPPFVGRGGLKLDYALDRFLIDVSSRVVVDVGASTGGFTDCLLQQGASRVYAIDVGYGQLDYRLRQDSRVVVMERVNARYPIILPEKADLITVDVSFISVQKIIPSVVRLLKDAGDMLVLIKPQFEAEPHQVGKGGVIKDKAIHRQTLRRVLNWAADHSLHLQGLIRSPITGPAGNIEFLAHLSTGPGERREIEIAIAHCLE